MDKLFPYNEEVEKQLAQAKRILHASMNGITSEGMSSLGYQLNYGVSTLRIKEIASEFSKNALLARRCWWSSCRELMIMGTLVFPADEPLSADEAEEWTNKCFNMELCEQLSFNLFSKRGASEAITIAKHLLSCEKELTLATGFILCCQLFKKGISDDSLNDKLLSNARKHMTSPSYNLYSTLAKALQSMVRTDRSKVESFITGWTAGNNKSTDYILEAVNTELLFS